MKKLHHTHPIDIKGIKTEQLYEQLSAPKLYNLDEMNQFLERHKLSKLQKEI